MSHFSVLVVTDEEPTSKVLARTLQPWHEFECTGNDDEYVVSVDITDETRSDFSRPRAIEPPQGVDDFATFAAEWHGYEVLTLGPDGEPIGLNLSGEHQFGYITLDPKTGDARVLRRTNPNRKWDWYVVGGRWPDQLLLKDGKRANCARVGDIDFEQMRSVNGLGAGSAPLEVFACVHGGVWLERGKMGYFACVSNEKGPADWNAELAAIFDCLKPDNYLTVVDCHI